MTLVVLRQLFYPLILRSVSSHEIREQYDGNNTQYKNFHLFSFISCFLKLQTLRKFYKASFIIVLFPEAYAIKSFPMGKRKIINNVGFDIKHFWGILTCYEISGDSCSDILMK